MTCPRCRAENRAGAKFCRECGATLGAVSFRLEQAEAALVAAS